MNKSYTYIILILVLLVANLWLFFNNSSADAPANVKYFDDLNLSRLSSIQFQVGDNPVRLNKSQEGWVLNEVYRADEGFTSTLISILQRVEVGRTVEHLDQPILGKVELAFDDNVIRAFDLATNSTKTKSYFIQAGVAKEVAVPGYRDNVIDLFTLHPDQWRDRLVFDGNWRTIQKVEVQFNNDKPSFEVKFDDKFFLINGQNPTDSTAVINYLNQYEYFQANEMISEGRFSNFDSLRKTQPMATITLDDIKNQEPTVFSVFPSIANQPFHLLIKDGDVQMVVDAGRVQGILSNPE